MDGSLTLDAEHGRMLQMIFGYGISQIVHVAAVLSLADHLADGALPATEIARREALDVGATARLLRACCAVGLTQQDGHGGFSATPLLATLRRGQPHSLWGSAVAQIGRGHWQPWGNLTEAIRTGEPQFRSTLGCDAWQYYSQTLQEAEAFTEAMAAISVESSADVARLVDTTGLQLAIDVGGAGGSLIQAVLERNSALKGIVLDLPHVVETVAPVIANLPLRDRLTALAGDFRTMLPPADLYLLRFILHDWDDETCVRILKNCRRGLSQKGRVVIAEVLVDETNLEPFGALIDMTMLALVGGRERTLEEFRALLDAADLTIVATPSTSNAIKIIEAAAKGETGEVAGSDGNPHG